MQSIVGTWKLLHATARDAPGAARPLPYGGKALGRVTFTADGRMMSVVCDRRKELPAGVSREWNSAEWHDDKAHPRSGTGRCYGANFVAASNDGVPRCPSRTT
jgi:hypothetical protein